MDTMTIFLAEAAKVLGATKSVLSFFDREPVRRDDLDFSSFADAMRGLCRDHRRDGTGVIDIQTVTGIFEAVRLFRPLSTDELHSGIESARRCHHWLNETFPDARPGASSN